MPDKEQRSRFIEAAGAEQMHVWDNALWQVMGGLRSSTIDETPFFGRARFQSAGRVKLCELLSSPVTVERDAANAKREDRDLVKITVQISGRSAFIQSGREVILDGAGWTFYDTARPYRVVNFTPVHQFVLLVPKADLFLSPLHLDRHGTRKFGVNAGVEKIFPNYIQTILSDGETATDEEAETLGDIATNLLRLSISGAVRERAGIPAQETLAFQVKQYIRAHIDDPELGVQRLAERFGCSKRHLHRAFSGNDLSLSDFIWQSRLERCAMSLKAERSMGMSIGQIAFQHGFNNFSHFSRMFHRHFGCTPSLYRQEKC
ncbi:helix-turn-helix domain-containing protein [Acidocella sp.]|uniref:helix-turn-helix domain-containing protein n=1 Tax=Acidocella sp. TaxID=50710 RepID=UPI003D06556F